MLKQASIKCWDLNINSLLLTLELSVAGHTGTDGVTAGNAKTCLEADADVHKLVSSAWNGTITLCC